MEIDNLLNSTQYFLLDVEKEAKNELNIIEDLKDLEYKKKQLTQELLGTKESKVYYSKAMELLHLESIGLLKDTLNAALSEIFYDRHLEADLIFEDKRGSKTLDLVLNDLDKGLYGLDPMECDGLGVATILSAINKIYLLTRKNSKVLLLDEKYGNVSKEYISRFFDFLNKLCKEEDFIILMVSHDNRFSEYVDNTINVQGGNFLVVGEKQ